MALESTRRGRLKGKRITPAQQTALNNLEKKMSALFKKEFTWEKLEPKFREIMVAVVLACQSYPTVPHHLHRAIHEGATVAEIVEAMQVGALFAGPRVLHHATPFIAEIETEIAAGKLGPK